MRILRVLCVTLLYSTLIHADSLVLTKENVDEYATKKMITIVSACNASSTKDTLASCMLDGAFEAVKEACHSPEVIAYLQTDSGLKETQGFLLHVQDSALMSIVDGKMQLTNPMLDASKKAILLKEIEALENLYTALKVTQKKFTSDDVPA